VTELARGTCRSCGALIVWAITDSGKRMPVDSEPHPAGRLTVWAQGDTWRVSVIQSPKWDGPRYRPHFATCDDAESWRQR
jgi:hypothetical protein